MIFYVLDSLYFVWVPLPPLNWHSKKKHFVKGLFGFWFCFFSCFFFFLINDLFRYSMYQGLYSLFIFKLLYLELEFLKLHKFLFLLLFSF